MVSGDFLLGLLCGIILTTIVGGAAMISMMNRWGR